MITELQNALPWLQSNITRCRGYRVTERVAFLEGNKTHCCGYRVIERIAMFRE